MLIKILYTLMFPTFLVVPFLYKNKRPAMLIFYRNMAMSFAFRKVYTKMLLLFSAGIPLLSPDDFPEPL